MAVRGAGRHVGPPALTHPQMHTALQHLGLKPLGLAHQGCARLNDVIEDSGSFSLSTLPALTL